VRPRDSHAIRVLEAHLTLSPPGETRWLYDALGNSVCCFTPQGEARRLSIVSDLVIERFPAPLLREDIADPQTVTPSSTPTPTGWCWRPSSIRSARTSRAASWPGCAPR